MFLLHIVLAMISLITYASLSTLESEPMSCKILYPLNHILNLILNVVLFSFYAATIGAIKFSNHEFFQKTQTLVIILGLFSLYQIIIKFAADNVCEFWTLVWHKVILRIVVSLVEGMVILMVFKWYDNKSSRVRDQMKLCILRLKSDAK